MSKKTLRTVEQKKVVIDLPKQLLEFLRQHERDMNASVSEYLQHSIICAVRADIEASAFFPELEIAKRWNLDKLLS